MAFVAALHLRAGYSGVDLQVVKSLLLKVGYPAGGITAFSVIVWTFRHRQPARQIYNAIRLAIRKMDKHLYRRNWRV